MRSLVFVHLYILKGYNLSLIHIWPEKDLSIAENFLRLLRPDTKFTELEARVLDLSLIHIYEWYRQLFERLDNSKFRSSFHLKQKDIDYINEKGLDTIRQHAADFIAKREAPAYIANDGKQTPMRGHPVFIAQHATATCCRECIRKWHKMQPRCV